MICVAVTSGFTIRVRHYVHLYANVSVYQYKPSITWTQETNKSDFAKTHWSLWWRRWLLMCLIEPETKWYIREVLFAFTAPENEKLKSCEPWWYMNLSLTQLFEIGFKMSLCFRLIGAYKLYFIILMKQTVQSMNTCQRLLSNACHVLPSLWAVNLLHFLNALFIMYCQVYARLICFIS